MTNCLRCQASQNYLVKGGQCDDCIGEEVTSKVAAMQNGQVLLENVRFHKEEEKNDPEFAKQLASNADVYVNDLWDGTPRPCFHRRRNSHLSPSVAGYLIDKIAVSAKCN